MTRRSSTRQLERDLYLTQRTIGDARVAATRGPGGLAKRVVKRRVHRTVLRTLRRYGLW